MYIVTIKNGNEETTIHDAFEKLKSGSVVKGINVIDSFTFSILPSNAGFDKIHDYTTLVRVYNTNTYRDEFFGRVLYTDTEMSENGSILKNVICESLFGFLCDSQQEYVEERNWTVSELLQHIIDVHNSQVEDYKQIYVANVSVTDPNDNIYCGIQRENSWDTIKKKLIDTLGGELRFFAYNDETYGRHIELEYIPEIGYTSKTSISVSKNMKSIVEEKDPSEIVTRLIPLGHKLAVEEGGALVETEKRLDITAVNDGKNYIEDEKAKEKYGIRVKSVEWDDVTDENNLLRKGREWLAENNKVRVKYTITALDLSLLGLDYNSFEVGNYHPVSNHLLGIDDTVRIIKKTVDICEEVKSSMEVGEKFESLSDMQTSQSEKLGELAGQLVTRGELNANIKNTQRLIEESNLSLKLEMSGEYVGVNEFGEFKKGLAATLELKLGLDDAGEIISMINASADLIELKSNRLAVESDNLKITQDGMVFMRGAQITMGSYDMNSQDYYLRLPDFEVLKINNNDDNAFIRIHRARIGGTAFDYSNVELSPQIHFTDNGFLLPEAQGENNRSCFVWENTDGSKIMRLRGNTDGLHLEALEYDYGALDFVVFGMSMRDMYNKLNELVGHTHKYTIESNTATCTTGGTITYRCACGDFYTETTGALGHLHTTKVENPEEGVCYYTICKDCGEKLSETMCAVELDSLSGMYVCVRCGAEYSEPPAVHKHNYYIPEMADPTCSVNGWIKYECSCGDTYTETLPATGHSYVDGVCSACGMDDPDYECPHTSTSEGGNVIDSCHQEMWTQCDSCGEIISTWTETSHETDERGYCTKCGEYVG